MRVTVHLACVLAGLFVWAGVASAVDFKQDLRGAFDPDHLQLHAKSSPTTFCKLTSEGVRITIPAGEKDGGSRGIATRFHITGDFEITAAYKILSLPEPGGGFGTGMAISMKDKSGEWASLQRVNQHKKGNGYVAHRGRPQPDKPGTYKHTVEKHPAQSMTGKLRLKREGTKLKYLVVDGDKDNFVQIREVDYPADEVTQIHFDAQTGQWPSAMDALWSSIEVQSADKQLATVRTLEPLPVPTKPTSPASGSPWWWLGIGGGCLAALAIGVWVGKNYLS